MGTSRRAFLKTAAAVPIAAAATSFPDLPIGAAPIPSAPIPVEHPFEWYFSYDGETYNEGFRTKDAALDFLKREGEGLIAECQRQDFDLDIEGSEILEVLYGHNEEAVGEGEFIDCTSEQERDLGDMVTETIYTWARKHKIDLAAWTFGVVRNQLKHGEIVDTTTTDSERSDR